MNVDKNIFEDRGINYTVPAPYSREDYNKAKEQGLDLDSWGDYEKFYGLGSDELDDWWMT